jgi:hypothetical protein
LAGDIKRLEKDAGDNFRESDNRRPEHIRREFNLPEDRDARELRFALQAELDKLELEAERREAAGDGDLDRLYSRMQRLEQQIERVSATENAGDTVEALGKQGADPENDNIVTGGAALSERELRRPPQSGTATKEAPDTKPLLLLAERIRDSNAPAREKVADRLQILAQNVAMMGTKDQYRLMDLRTAKKVSEVSDTVNALARKYADRIMPPGKKAEAPKAKPVEVEGSPDPKAVAAKKAAFLEKAASGDAALIKELQASTDAKGLQRAVEALNNVELTDANEAHITKAVETINARLGELMQNPDVAYGMGTKKYSLLSTQIHNDLQRGGLPHHDSGHLKSGQRRRLAA